MAPHPDDEVIGPGASIYRYLQQGDKVKVIMITRGEGFFWARKIFSKQLFTNFKELVTLGDARTKETLKEKNNNWSRINNRLYLRINKEIVYRQ